MKSRDSDDDSDCDLGVLVLSTNALFRSNFCNKYDLFRTSNYQKKMTRLGSIAFQKICAIHMQRVWRGYNIRRKFKTNLKVFYRTGKGDESRRLKFYRDEFNTLSTKIQKNFDDRQDRVDLMLRLEHNFAVNYEFIIPHIIAVRWIELFLRASNWISCLNKCWQ